MGQFLSPPEHFAWGAHMPHFLRVPTIRESQGENYFSGNSGNLSCFLRIRENQGIIFVTGEWSGKVREFSSDSGQLTV